MVPGLSALAAGRVVGHARTLARYHSDPGPGRTGKQAEMATMEELLGGHPFFAGLGPSAGPESATA